MNYVYVSSGSRKMKTGIISVIIMLALSGHAMAADYNQMHGAALDRAKFCFAYTNWIPENDAILGADPIETGLALLARVICDDKYSDYLADSYYAWRAMYQMNWGGCSSTSAIYTQLYETRKNHIIEVIDRHLSSHPEDQQAMAQKHRLERMAPVVPIEFGNTALFDIGAEEVKSGRLKISEPGGVDKPSYWDSFLFHVRSCHDPSNHFIDEASE